VSPGIRQADGREIQVLGGTFRPVGVAVNMMSNRVFWHKLLAESKMRAELLSVGETQF